MNKIKKALLKRQLKYRTFRLKRAKAKKLPGEISKWSRLLRETKARLNPKATINPPTRKPSKPRVSKPISKKPTRPKKKPSTTYKGIDVYEGEGSIDWEKVKAAGYDFAFCKVSEGGDFLDKSWNKDRVAAMRAAKVKIGVYHFLRPRAGRSGAVEARFFIRNAKKAGWGKPGDLRPVIDFEATDLDPAKTQKYLAQAVAEVKKLTGKAPIIYTGGPFWNENTNSSTINWYCPLWLAAYVKNPEQYVPAAWKKRGWSIWQFTDQGKVAGISVKNVDQNVAKHLPVL